MTRDEARFKLLEGTDGKCTERFMDDFLDSAVALGMLKLDEQKSAPDFAREALRKAGYLASTIDEILCVLDRDDLQIIGK